MQPSEMRRALIDTAPDHYKGDELETYIDRVVDMTDDLVLQEYNDTFSD